MAVAVCGVRRGHRCSGERGGTLVEVAVATALLAASVAIIGAGLQIVALLGERAMRADAERRVLEIEIAHWSSAVMSVCAEGQTTVIEAQPGGAILTEPPMVWSAGGQWSPLPSVDCAQIVAAGVTGPTVLRWRVQSPGADPNDDPVEVVTRAVWP